MKRISRRLMCIFSCAFLLFTGGCHGTDYAEKEQKEAEETVVEILDESMAEAQVKAEKSSVEQGKLETDGEYSSFLWKSWIVDEPVNGNDQFGFIITKVNDKEIEGVIVIGDDAGWYWYGSERCRPFKGTITENQAVCTFQYEDCQVGSIIFVLGT